MNQPTRQQQEAFLRALVPAAATVCPRYGLDPKQCLAEAAAKSGWGRYALGHNFWGLVGKGDAGYYTTVRPVRTFAKEGGGWAAQGEQVAKFSGPIPAVEAWCLAKRGV